MELRIVDEFLLQNNKNLDTMLKMLPRAILDTSKLWPNGSVIHVSFYRFTSNDTLDVNLNAYIAKLITDKIAPYVNLSFVFDLTNDSNAGDIQIGYASDANTHLMSIYGNKIGTDSFYTKNNQNNVTSLYLYKPAIAPSGTTFSFGGQSYTTPTFDQSGMPESYIGMSVLRNVCMALGMVNEIRNPVGMSLSFDINQIVQSFLQQYPNSSVTEAQLRYFYEPYLRSQVIGSSYDTQSIMNYTTATNTFLIQLTSYNTALSGCDKTWLMNTYPKASYSLPNGETKYGLQQSCLTTAQSGSIGGFEWSSPSPTSDVYELRKAGALVAQFKDTGTLTVPSVQLSQPPVAQSQGSFLSLGQDGTIAVDTSIQNFKSDLVGTVNTVINRVNELQSTQTNTFSVLSGGVLDTQNFVSSKLGEYEIKVSGINNTAQQQLTNYNARLMSNEQLSTQNRTHIDDLYTKQNSDRANLTLYTDAKTKTVQDDVNSKASALSGRLVLVEATLPQVQTHLNTLTSDMQEWSDIQTTTQNLQTQLIENMETISTRFDAFESLESRFSQEVQALTSRVAFTLDSFQSIQTVITQNYNNLASQVLPALAQVNLLKQDVAFLKTSSFVLIAVLAVMLIALFVYVFGNKISSKGTTP